jgi:hypothetical protein
VGKFVPEELEAGFTAILAVWLREICDENGGEGVLISRLTHTKLLYESGDQKMEISVRCVTDEIENAKKAENLRNVLGSKPPE